MCTRPQELPKLKDFFKDLGLAQRLPHNKEVCSRVGLPYYTAIFALNNGQKASCNCPILIIQVYNPPPLFRTLWDRWCCYLCDLCLLTVPKLASKSALCPAQARRFFILMYRGTYPDTNPSTKYESPSSLWSKDNPTPSPLTSMGNMAPPERSGFHMKCPIQLNNARYWSVRMWAFIAKSSH